MSHDEARRGGKRTSLLVVLVLVLAGLSGTRVAAASSEPAGDTRAPQRWSGYSIAATGRAAGGWIGGYRVGRTELYLTTPSRRPNRTGFGDRHLVDDLAGRGASRAETARAAWILSKYGGYRDATQAAAVDATVYHLLVGGPWQVGGRRGERRVRQSGDPASVARFARFMLRQSRRSAGAYAARLTASGADVGGTVAVTLSVADGHGRPAAGLPVTLRMAGDDPRTAVTGDDGRAVARFPADGRGWQDVTAEVRNVPDHRLHLWRPEKGAQAAAAEGGRTRTVVVAATAAVRGPQTLSLSADPGQLVVGSPARVVATVAGDGSRRTATASLRGPFASAGAVGCDGPSAGQVSASVGADGAYPMPTLTPASGYFAWSVAVDGTATNAPVSACGATVKVRTRATTSITAHNDVVTDGELRATGTVAGLPFSDGVTLTATLAGPYHSPQQLIDDGCNLLRYPPATRVRSGNGAADFEIEVTDLGWYGWQLQASSGDLWSGSRSGCAAGASVVGVVGVQ